jgi:hypothetical protein
LISGFICENQEANETAQSGNFDEAKKIYQEILDELTALNDPSLSEQIAILIIYWAI